MLIFLRMSSKGYFQGTPLMIFAFSRTAFSRIEAAASIYFFHKQRGFYLSLASIYRILSEYSALSNSFFITVPFDILIQFFFDIAFSNNSPAFQYSTGYHYFANNLVMPGNARTFFSVDETATFIYYFFI